MNYQHFYHAGSHADVFKQLTLMALLHSLKTKEKPFCYLDTHAGEGEYNLLQNTSKEWQTGIGQIINVTPSHFLLKQYLEIVSNLHHFKGSPLLAKKLLRAQDDIILIEKSETAYQRLKQLFRQDKQVHLHQGDAYLIVKGLLPPQARRGLLFIDPPYEDKQEFEKVTDLLKIAMKKFPTGIIALWYPLKSRLFIQGFYKEIQKQLSNTIHPLIVEFCPWPDDIAIRLNGSGMMILNPPYQLEEMLSPLLEELIQVLKQHPKGFYRLKN